MFKRLSEKFLLISMYTGALGLLCLLPASAQYDPSPLTGYESIDPDNQILDFLVQGEYIGVSGNDTRIGVQVIAQGDSIFDAHFFEGGVPGDGVTDSDDHTSVPGQLDGMIANFDGSGITAAITLSDSTLRGQSGSWGSFELKKIFRRSTTLDAAPPEGAYVVYRSSEDAGNLENGRINEYGNIHMELEDGSEAYIGKETNFNLPFPEFHIHLEFSNPFQPYNRNQARGNSGVIYRSLPGRLETQVLESFGMANQDNHCGGFYGKRRPNLIMSYPPLSWQTYDIFVIGGLVNVYHNGVLIQENFNSGSTDNNGRFGLQDHAHPVQFRNIWALETQTVELVPGPVGIRRLEGGFHPGRITVGKIVPGFTSMPDIQGIIRLYKLDGSVCRANTAMKQLMPGVFIKPASD